MVVPNFVRQALAEQPITVYGDGTQRRCFCHVADVVDAMLGLMDREDVFGEVFNIGSEEETSIAALAERVRDAAGSDSEIVHVPYDEAYEEGFEDMDRRVPDLTKIADVADWRPTRSLDQIIEDVIAYQRAPASHVRGRVMPSRQPYASA